MPGEDRPHRRLAFALSLLAAAVLACYANSLGNGFVFDDYDIFVNRPEIRSFRYLPRVLGLETGHSFYRPVRFVSYMLDHALYGLNPAGFRASNLFYHFLASTFAYLLLWHITASRRVALCAALLFAVHPVQTESVTYLAGRRDLLFSLFYLMGCYFFLRYDETRHRAYAVGLVAAFLLGLYSKEMAVTLPVVVYAYLVLRNMPSDFALRPMAAAARKAFNDHRIVFAILFAIALLYAVDRSTVSNPSKVSGFHGGGPTANFMTVIAIIAQYFKLLLFPIELNADYSYNAFPIVTSFTDVRFLAGVLILLVFAAQLVIAFSFDRWITYGGFWILVTLLPVCQIVPHHEMMAEHYLYLPMLGFALTVTLLLHHFLARPSERWIFFSLAAVVLVLAAVRTIDRNRDWRDDLTLWSQTTRTAPGSARAQNNYGKALMQSGEIEPAIKAFRHAVAIRPGYAEALANLGVAYGAAGMTGQAMQYFRQALEINPQFAEVHFNIGVSRLQQGRYGEAEAAFREATAIRPWFAAAHYNLGKLYARGGDGPRALEHFTRVIRADPGSQIARDAQNEIDTLEKK